MAVADLRKQADIAPNTMTRMKKDQEVTMQVLERICKLENAIEDLFYQFVMYLNRMGEVDFENVFIDGTKIEANANKYSFVWRSAVEKNYEKLQKKLEAFTALLKDVYSLSETMAAEDCGLYLAELAKTVQLVFRYGKGQHKTPLQRDIEQLTELLDRKYKYIDYLSEFQGRKSFFKTDRAATFIVILERLEKELAALDTLEHCETGWHSEGRTYISNHTAA